MRTANVLAKIIMWILMVIYAFMNGTAVIAIFLNGSSTISYPIIFSAGLMLIACVIFMTPLKKLRPFCVGAALLATLVMVAISPEMMRIFPMRIGTGGADQGLNLTRLLLRHTGIALVAAAMLVAWLTGRSADKDDARRLLGEDRKGFNLSGEKLFRDEDGAEQAESGAKKKEKRSIRKRREKESMHYPASK